MKKVVIFLATLALAGVYQTQKDKSSKLKLTEPRQAVHPKNNAMQLGLLQDSG
ncbi:hypothetical protein ABN209_23900 [Klebsiella pneumoniae]|uniref:hypothetical protein n=1 Tax=Klebsiella pneumoniae TaxID=573 RepID=UPI00164C93D4|nr:hypothetical protein [Klebsiella pneumoniae]MBC4900798.1 hypothetical protein [Klebsiella pneumoniae]MBN6551699.1 hypothetical protein [Klebsiella pneumoniae]MBV0609765.1 hypothetical protein [Klebsiella pneumoniae]MCP5618039.1 hypothetical protein [Klebsiella pneumoniae]